jgi:hypothetical protein
MKTRTLIAVPFVASALTFAGGLLANSAQSDQIECQSATSAVSVSGRLTLQLFAGAPNFESIAKGDSEERTLILELDKPTCLKDDDFSETSNKIDRAQLYSSTEGLRQVIEASVGRKVIITGEGFGSHTGHHHAPLVIDVKQISVQ